ncbi:MAG: RluA family pseudouridine synthase [Flavobacteriales bacterium]|nr:RluA family pseudouridine synthase [Flavobacteriales bacterium]
MQKRSGKSNFSKKSRLSTFTVQEEVELLPFLLSSIKDKSRTKIKGMLSHKQFMVNQSVTTQFDQELKPGDKVVVSWDGPHRKQSYEGVKIVFEDDQVIVINKRSGLLSVGSEKEKKQTAYRIVTTHIRQENPVARLFVVHRLDREASGLMVFAKNKNAQMELKESWASTSPKNMYLAVTEGTVQKDTDTLQSFLKESKALIVHETKSKKEGKPAITRYQVVKKNEYFTLMELYMDTERKHQFRVQLQGIKHPVLGDKKYGSNQNPIGRMALHLRKLTFIHPATYEEMTFETKVPEDFLQLFRYKYYD